MLLVDGKPTRRRNSTSVRRQLISRDGLQESLARIRVTKGLHEKASSEAVVVASSNGLRHRERACRTSPSEADNRAGTVPFGEPRSQGVPSPRVNWAAAS